MKAKLILILTLLTLSVFGVETNSENSSKEEKKSNVNTKLIVEGKDASTATSLNKVSEEGKDASTATSPNKVSKDASTATSPNKVSNDASTSTSLNKVSEEGKDASTSTSLNKVSEEGKDASTATSPTKKESKEEIKRRKRLRYLAYKRSKLLQAKKQKQAKKKSMSLPKWIKDDGISKDKVMIWGGMGNLLYGYTDERYAGYDKGAYLKAKSYNTGIEYYKEDFGDYISGLKDIKFGVNIAFQTREGFGEKELPSMDYVEYGTTRNIPTKTVPSDQRDVNPESWINLGFFAGLNNKWYGIDLGLTIFLNPYYQKERLLLNDKTEKVEEWYWGDATMIPNFRLRLGKEDSAHFVFNILREDYDLKYGVINIYLSLPLSQYFGLDIGGNLYQTDSIFIAPKIMVAGVTAKFKFGTILNYQDEVFTKVAIFDSLFGSVSLSYEW